MTTLGDFKQVSRQVDEFKRQSRRLRDLHELEKARAPLCQAIELLETELGQRRSQTNADEPAPQDVRALAAQLADCFGSMGGILRRLGSHEEALIYYQKGRDIEQNPIYRISNSYNQVQWLVLQVLLGPNLIEDGKLSSDLDLAIQSLRRQIMGARSADPWAHSDLGLLLTLKGEKVAAERAWDEVGALNPLPSVYTSGLPVLKDLAKALPLHVGLQRAIDRFEKEAALLNKP
jgi:tetratricopeptide (TPR) repeat protein